MVAVLVCVYFALRVLERPDHVEALAAGLAAGVAIAIKPSNSVFVAGLILGVLYRRRFVGAAYVLAGLVPALATLALWKYRGLGYLPLFHAQGGTKLALGAHQDLVAFNPLHKYVHLDWHKLNLNLLRHQGALLELARRGVARHRRPHRAEPSLAHCVSRRRRLVRRVRPHEGDVRQREYRRRQRLPHHDARLPGVHPAARVAGLPVSRTPPRTIRRAEPSRLRPRRRLALLGAGAAVFALYPLALVAAASPLQGPQPRAYEAFGLLRSIDPGLRLTAAVVSHGVRLNWNDSQPAGTKVFYRVWRTRTANGGASCTPVPHAAANCQLAMDDLGAHDGVSWVDKPGRGAWTYRLGLAANWLNSPLYGDVYSFGPPVVVRVP